MSVQAEIFVDVDIDLEIPCEDQHHGQRVPGLDEPAQYLVWWQCNGCRRQLRYNSCIPCWSQVSSGNIVNDTKCGMTASYETKLIGKL